jgi:endo-1,4-beta-xylanase
LTRRSSVLEALAVLAVALAVTLAAACGGGGSDPVAPPAEKSCQQDPTQAKCPTTTPPATATLRALAAARGKAIGVAVGSAFFAGTTPLYDSTVAREFNAVVAENEMKWSAIHRDSRFVYRWAGPDRLAAFALANGMKVRGHTLVWHQQNPAWLTSGTWSADTLRQLLREHVDSVVGHYKGKVFAWDVVNEALQDGTGALRTAGSPWAPALGRAYIDVAFAEARAADPAALLFYNDYGLEAPGAKQDSAFALIQGMKARGVPVDGIGFQAHFLVNADGGGAPSRQTLLATFARFAALGLKIELTELDVRIPSPNPPAAALAAQSRVYSDAVAACVETSACDAVLVWGLRDSESWVPGTFPGWGQPLLFDAGFGKKATYDAVRSALGG